MKKLLALVLCVMMFVSVLSTAAFADKPTTPATPTWTEGGWNSANVNNKAIKNAKANIEYMYGALAADNAVFGTIKSVDEVVTSLVKDMFKDVDSINANIIGMADREVGHDKLVDNTKGVLRDVIGTSIITYMNKHMGDFATASTTYTDQWGDKMTYLAWGYDNAAQQVFYFYEDGKGNLYAMDEAGKFWQYQANPGTWTIEDALARRAGYLPAEGNAPVTATTTYKYDPIKYVNTFATATSKALNDEKSAAGLQRYLYELAQLKVYSDVKDDLDDLKDAIDAWQGTDGILAQYHFHNAAAGDWNPYAMLNENFYPNAFTFDPAILAP